MAKLEEAENETEIGVDPKFRSCWINDQMSPKQAKLKDIDSMSWEITSISIQSP